MPNVVKGSKQQKMVVVPHRPGRKAIYAVYLFAVVVVVALGAYYVGQYRAYQVQAISESDVSELSQELAILRAENSDFRRQVAVLGRSTVMDQRVNAEAQTTIRDLRERVAQLEQDVVYYRQVVGEETESTGLVIGQFDISATSDPDRFRYKLVMRQQDADGDSYLTGHVNVSLIGRQDNDQVVYPLRDLSDNQEQLDIRLRFRYFQNIEGELALPAGFRPDRIQISAVSTEPVEKNIAQDFSWVVEGE